MTLHFEAPFGGLGETYALHLMLIEKLVVDFLFVLIDFFSLNVMAEALRANIDCKSEILKDVGHPTRHIIGHCYG